MAGLVQGYRDQTVAETVIHTVFTELDGFDLVLGHYRREPALQTGARDDAVGQHEEWGSDVEIAIFGATGKTGHHLVEQALSAGHEVRAFVRGASRLRVRHERLQIVEGNVMDTMQVDQAVSNTDAVLSTLGHTKTSTNDVQTVGAENIAGAMKKNGVSRLASLTGAGVRDDKDHPKFIDRVFGLLLKLLQPAVLEDAERHAEVTKASDLDWVIVRAPRLTDRTRTGEYRVGYVDNNSGTKISRADAADFMLRQLIDDERLRQQPMISY